MPEHRVIKSSDKEYQILCSICAAVAAEFTIGPLEFMGVEVTKDERLNYYGISTERELEIDDAGKVFALLDAGDLAALQEFLKERYGEGGMEGIDAYCPECDSVYCLEHYNVEEVYDEGYHECSWGTCPEGHRRKIDE